MLEKKNEKAQNAFSQQQNALFLKFARERHEWKNIFF
jgi:hypothetical protein